ncbi:MAG: GtrA family protein [Polyangiaceae bacterium]
MRDRLPDLRVLARHQLGAFLASVLDLSVMTMGVELVGLRPSIATAVGAVSGAVANFLFSRHVVFAARAGSRARQAARYALVAAASLALNAGGVWLLAERIGLAYFGARLLVSISVSLGWNYPMHRYFVFRASPQPIDARSSAAPREGGRPDPGVGPSP